MAIGISDQTLTAGTVTAAVAFFLPSNSVVFQWYTCPIRLVTGLPCPGCGSTRAWTTFLHGHVEAAMAENPFAVVLLVSLLLIGAWRLMSLVVSMIPRPNVGDLVFHPIPKSFAVVWIIWAVFRASTHSLS